MMKHIAFFRLRGGAVPVTSGNSDRSLDKLEEWPNKLTLKMEAAWSHVPEDKPVRESTNLRRARSGISAQCARKSAPIIGLSDNWSSDMELMQGRNST